MRRLLLSLTLLLALPALLPGGAGAHVEIAPTKAPAAKPVELAFVVGHGCDGAATNRLIAQMPEGVVAARPLSTEGWKARSAGGRLVWSGGPLGDHDHGEFPFKATLAGKKGDRLAFKVIQRCEGGAETAWIQVGGDGGHGHDELEAPAPILRLTSTGDPLAAADDSGHAGAEGATGEEGPAATAETDAASAEQDEDDGGGGSPLRVFGLVLIVAALTAFLVLQRNRRRG